MKDDIVVPAWILLALIGCTILLTMMYSINASVSGETIKKLRAENQLLHLQVDEFKRYPSWLKNAYDSCIPDEVPDIFLKECTALNIQMYAEWDRKTKGDR